MFQLESSSDNFLSKSRFAARSFEKLSAELFSASFRIEQGSNCSFRHYLSDGEWMLQGLNERD